MGMLVLAGEKLNVLEDDVLSCSPAADVLYPLSALCDGRPSQPFRWGSVAADPYVQRDGNRVTNGGFETSTLAGWTDDSDTASGFTTSEELAIFNTGAKALKMTTAAVGSKKASRYWDIPNVRTGALWNWTWAGRGDGTRTSRFRVQNRHTGMYWTGSVWSAVATDLATRATATYATSAGAFTVESMAACRSALVTLRITCLATDATAGAAYADDVYLWPSFNFVSLHGHKNTEGLTCIVLSGTDGAAFPTTRAMPTIAQPAFYSKLSTPSPDRYARFKFVGTPLAAPEIGELIFGQALSVLRSPNMGYEVRELESDVYNETPVGDGVAYAQTYHARRALACNFSLHTRAGYEEARDEVWRRSRGRKTPLVIVPDESLVDVFLIRQGREWKVIRTFVNLYDENDLVGAELPFAAAS